MVEEAVLTRITPRQDKLLYQQVQERVKAGIEAGVFQPGSKLPPLKDLAKAFRVNHITIRKGLDLLEKEGILAAQPGVGIFVCGTEPRVDSRSVADANGESARQLNIGLVCVDAYQIEFAGSGVQMHPAVHQWLKGIRDSDPSGRVAAQVFPNDVIQPPGADADNPLSKALVAGQLDGLIVGKYLDQAQYEALSQWEVPVVLMSHEMRNTPYASVSIDRGYGLRLLVRHLRALGHQRIRMLGYRGSDENYQQNLEQTLRIMAAEGQAEFTVDDYVTVANYPGPLDWQACFDGANRVLDRNPTAVIASDELLANHLMWAASQRSLAVPRDLALASLVDMLPESHALPLTTLSTCDAEQEAARVAMDLLARQVAGEDVRGKEITIMPALSVGQTTGRVAGG